LLLSGSNFSIFDIPRVRIFTRKNRIWDVDNPAGSSASTVRWKDKTATQSDRQIAKGNKRIRAEHKTRNHTGILHSSLEKQTLLCYITK